MFVSLSKFSLFLLDTQTFHKVLARLFPNTCKLNLSIIKADLLSHPKQLNDIHLATFE